MPEKPSGPAAAPSSESAVSGRGHPRTRWLADYGPPLGMMALIFVASTGAGTSQHSGWLLQHVLAWLGLAPQLASTQLEAVNHYARKAAHLTEYALLAGLLHRAVAARHREAMAWQARWAPRRVLAVVALVALYAASDEIHQLFVAARTPAVADVVLDTVGGMVGLAVKGGWERWRRRSSGSVQRR